MTRNRSNGAWIWVAMAAISFASLARVQSGVENARTYADPVIKFFAAAHQADVDVSARSHRAASKSQSGASGVALDLLAVYFVGLVTPLVLQRFRPAKRQQRLHAAPLLSNLFQRPPPVFVA